MPILFKTPLSDFMDARKWRRLVAASLGFAIFCAVSASLFAYFRNTDFGEAFIARAVINSMILSFLLATPIVAALGLKLFEVQYMNDKLERLATTDMLTGCLNRRALMEIVDRHMSMMSEERAEMGGAFLIVDADYFKRINDELGHMGGDAALRHIATVVKSVVRENDAVARIGGEEFAVFLPEVDAKGARAIAERIVVAVHSTPFAANGNSVRLAVSVGGTAFNWPERFERLYRQADANLYTAKENGRDQVVFPKKAA